MKANILVPDDGPVKSQRRCPACDSRLMIGRARLEGKLICQNDGFTVDTDPADAKPESTLTDTTVQNMLCQPNSDLGKPDEDLPASSTLISDVDLNENTDFKKRRISQVADVTVFL